MADADLTSDEVMQIAPELAEVPDTLMDGVSYFGGDTEELDAWLEVEQVPVPRGDPLAVPEEQAREAAENAPKAAPAA